MEEGYLVMGDAATAARLRMAGVAPLLDWDASGEDEPLIHRIHPYPAKFPAFVPTRAFDLAARRGLDVRQVADIFCGCGTVALESRRRGFRFWGCDVNPVASLIARAKSADCRSDVIRRYTGAIARNFRVARAECDLSAEAERRLRRWFADKQFRDLAMLRNSIDHTLPERGCYRDVFLCAFSAILKPVSQWRARSNKPALDLGKQSPDVLSTFLKHCDFLARAWDEHRGSAAGPVGTIETASALRAQPPNRVDLLVTSPPYVTSYEYSDLHQLSILWLGHASDHRAVRSEMIGSAAGAANFSRDFQRLNSTGSYAAFSLYGRNPKTAERIVRYYLDMQQIAKRAFAIMSDRGLAVFLIGNAEVHGIKLDNATHLAEALLEAGFSRVLAGLRRLSNKANTPYRTPEGRLSSTPDALTVYANEFVLIAEK